MPKGNNKDSFKLCKKKLAFEYSLNINLFIFAYLRKLRLKEYKGSTINDLGGGRRKSRKKISKALLQEKKNLKRPSWKKKIKTAYARKKKFASNIFSGPSPNVPVKF